MHTQNVFPGLAVSDITIARDFYRGVLGLDVEEDGGFLNLELGSGRLFVYAKEDHVPAAHTVLNFVVSNIDEAVAELNDKGIEMIRYESMQQDARGIQRPPKPEYGPDIAWFTDPAGNIFSLIQG